MCHFFKILIFWVVNGIKGQKVAANDKRLCISVNQSLRHNLGSKQKIIQFIRRNQVYFSSSNVSTDTTVIVKDYMLSEKFTLCFKITIKWNHHMISREINSFCSSSFILRVALLSHGIIFCLFYPCSM